MGLTLGGLDYWNKAFGFTSYDQWYDQVGQYIPHTDFMGFGLTQQQVAEEAWNAPFTVFGAAAIVIAAAKGGASFTDQQARTTQSVASAAIATGGYGRMAQLIIPGIFQVAIHATSGGQQVDNVIGVQNSGGSAAAAAAAVRTAWKVASGPLSQLTSAYALVDFTAVDIGSANGDISVVTDTTTGQAGTAQLSTNAACALIKWNGGTRSRSSRGRLYFGPLYEACINADGRTLSSSYKASLETAFNNFRTSLEGSGYPLVVVSRKLASAFPVTSQAVETVIATQRRRIRT